MARRTPAKDTGLCPEASSAKGRPDFFPPARDSGSSRPDPVWPRDTRFRQAPPGPTMMNVKRKKLYEGKAKILYEGPEPGTLIQYFKDDATAFNAQKRGTISGKGVFNNKISEHIFVALKAIGVPTHFIRRLNMREQLIRQVEIVPIE